MKNVFNQTAPVFIQRSSIHDLCSKQIASLIKQQKWIKPTDSIMVVYMYLFTSQGLRMWGRIVYFHVI